MSTNELYPQDESQTEASESMLENISDIPQKQKKVKKRKKPLPPVLWKIFCVILILTNLVSLTAVSTFYSKKQGTWFSSTKLSQIRETIDTYFYEDVTDEMLAEGVYRGVVAGLDDPYSMYYTKEEYEELQREQEGNYSGIGAALLKDDESGYVEITRVYENSPAEEAGLREGDLIISADDVFAIDVDVSDLAAAIRGEAGTTVDIVYVRNGETKEVTIERRQVERSTVTHEMLDNQVGYIRMTEFIETTDDDFEKSVSDLLDSGMKALIIDVRGNPGGLVDAVVSICDQILPEGVVVYTEDKNGERYDYTSDDKLQLNIPIAVLMNENSASASEILAGALRDYDAATLIGTKTYGKGIVQGYYLLYDGSAVKLTFSAYYTPKGENIHKKGIQPDVEVEMEYTGDEEAEYDYHYDSQVVKALKLIEQGEVKKNGK